MFFECSNTVVLGTPAKEQGRKKRLIDVSCQCGNIYRILTSRAECYNCGIVLADGVRARIYKRTHFAVKK